MSSAGLRMPALLPREPVAQGLREHVLQGSSGLPAGLTYSRFPQTLQPSGPCRLTWAEHWDAPPPALGTRMNTGHPRVIESRGLVCWCKWGSAVNRGERESTRLTQAAFTFHQDSCRNFQNSFPVLIWGQCPASPVYFPHRARMSLKNIGLTPTCFPSSKAAYDYGHRHSKPPCSLACWSLWSPQEQSWMPGSLHPQEQD